MLVELDEDPGTTSHERTGRLRPRWWVAVLVVAVLALVTAQVLADARERSRVAGLARVPGVVAPLPAAPRETWRLHDDATDDVLVVDGSVVEERVADDGALTIEARDPASGQERWSVPLLGPPDQPLPPAATRYGVQCADGPGLPGRLVCLAHDATAARTRYGQAAGSATATSTPATAAQVTVVDTGTGEVLARHPAGSGGTVAAAVGVVGAAAVLAAPLAGATAVWALDPATGAERWRVRADTGFGGGWLRWGAEVRVLPVGDDAVAVLGAGAVLLDAGDGAVLATAGTLATVTGTLRDGSAVVIGSEGSTRLVGTAGEVRVLGAPVPVTVDDGSVPDLVLTTSGGLRAWDARSGEERWRTRGVVVLTEALVLDGRVHVHDGYRVATLDAATGEVLWEVTAPEAAGSDAAVVTGLATDGVHLLVATRDAETSRAALLALGPVDGTPRWRADVPGARSVEDVDGVLLGRTRQDAVVLR